MVLPINTARLPGVPTIPGAVSTARSLSLLAPWSVGTENASKHQAGFVIAGARLRARRSRMPIISPSPITFARSPEGFPFRAGG
jgi:hypothetical protein